MTDSLPIQRLDGRPASRLYPLRVISRAGLALGANQGCTVVVRGQTGGIGPKSQILRRRIAELGILGHVPVDVEGVCNQTGPVPTRIAKEIAAAESRNVGGVWTVDCFPLSTERYDRVLDGSRLAIELQTRTDVRPVSEERAVGDGGETLGVDPARILGGLVADKNAT